MRHPPRGPLPSRIRQPTAGGAHLPGHEAARYRRLPAMATRLDTSGGTLDRLNTSAVSFLDLGVIGPLRRRSHCTVLIATDRPGLGPGGVVVAHLRNGDRSSKVHPSVPYPNLDRAAK